MYQEQIAEEEQRLHEADKDLASQRATLSPEDFAERRGDFEGRVAEVQRMAQERRRQLDQVASAAFNEVRAAMIQVLDELAEARGFNLVVPPVAFCCFRRRSILPPRYWRGSTSSCRTSRCPRRSIDGGPVPF